ncbi:MAG: hypothetical protein AAFX90_15895 [Pseudomonadota bacterium]
MHIRLAALVIVIATLILSFGGPSASEREYVKQIIDCHNGTKYSKVISACGTLLERSDEPPEARHIYHGKRVQAFYRSGRFEEAIADADQALDLKADDTTTLVWRGFSKNELGDEAGARSDFRRAVQISPDDKYVLFYHAKQMEAWGEIEAARSAYEKVLEIDAGYRGAGTRYLLLVANNMSDEEFVRSLSKAEQRWPDHTWVHWVRIFFELEHSFDLDKALRAAEAYVRLKPDWEDGLFLFALIHTKIGDETKAIEYVEAYAKQGDKISWGDDGYFRKMRHRVSAYILTGHNSEWIYRSHAFAALGKAGLAKAEYQKYLDSGGRYAPTLLLDVIEGAGVTVDPKARAGSTEHIDKAIDDHIRHLEQKMGFSELGPQTG